jgi:hypothetical protein
MTVDGTATFFFALFWAAMTAAAARFIPFDSFALWVECFRRKHFGPASRRFMLAILTLDVLPIVFLIAWLWFVKSKDYWAIVASASAALPLFGIYRVFVGFVLHSPRCFQDLRLRRALRGCDGGDPTATIYSGMVWIAVFAVAACVISCVFHNSRWAH